MMKKGMVYLVGAGPGDAGLITVRGLECLRRADVVIYDRLLDERLLDAAPAAAEKIYVGKKAGKHPRPQEEINRLLGEKAGEGKRVVRLKGGDPFVLGRGGEEAEALKDSGIPFEVVPGVTSAIAVPAYAGIPVTHRGTASSFAVITGHEDPKKETSGLDWKKLAAGADTLVFLMGVRNLPEIAARLVEHGRPAATPVAVIGEGTKPEQRTVAGTLGDIAARVKESRLEPPAVIVVGEVVGLREGLRWFDNRPLFGRRVLVTRARHQSGTLSRLLTERGAVPVAMPAIEVKPLGDTAELDRAISGLASYDWVLFTSINGVAAFWERLSDMKRDGRVLGGCKIGVIGPATAAALTGRGIIPDFIPESYTSEGLLAGLEQQGIAGKRCLLPRTDIADDTLAEGIRRLGAEANEVAAYRTLPAAGDTAEARRMLVAGEIDVITFTSSSTVSGLVAAFGGELPVNRARIACIGPKTAEAAAGAGLRVDILAAEATLPGLVAAIEAFYREET